MQHDDRIRVQAGGEASEAIRHPDGANMGEWGFTSDTQLRKSALAACKKKG